MTMLITETLRLRTLEHDGAVWFEVDIRNTNDEWRILLGNGLLGTAYIWTPDPMLYRPDPQVEWREGDDDRDLKTAKGVFSEAALSPDERALVLTGRAGCLAVEMTLRPQAANRIHITVKVHLKNTEDPVWLGRMMTHLFVIPDGRASRSFEPLEFAWLPNLHKTEEGVCGDHFFRSPAVMVFADGLYAGIVPDLDVFAAHCALPHALDLRAINPGNIDAPRLSYGICPYQPDGHVYTRHAPGHTVPIDRRELEYAFTLFLGEADTPHTVSRMITSYLWDRYGHRAFTDIRPQVLPFEEYGRLYTYTHELPRSVRDVTIDGSRCTGIDNAHRRGANFHAWENDLQVGFGIRHYADRWQDASLRAISDGILQLVRHAPGHQGAFPCVYNFDDERYEGALFWTARVADFRDGYDAAAMGVTTWWLLYWYEHFGPSPEILERVTDYARFLNTQQLPSGAIPTYFFSDLTHAKQLRESATTAISGAVLAKVACLTDDPDLTHAALRAARYVEEKIMPGLVFNDFEVFYSCSPKPLHAVDEWTGIRPQNNLSLQWACDQMLAVYRLTNDAKWLADGEYLLSILSLYQQVWNPAHRSGYLFGGFGVMNTDGEWSDGRQARFVPTYADYYTATGNIEYLERSVAACRASFALMDTLENHRNDINQAVMGEKLDADRAAHGQAEPGMGYAGENIHHGGMDEHRCTWTGMSWSAGGGLAASAYLERCFGSLWVDGAHKTVTPVDGLNATIESWEGTAITLRVDSALAHLQFPYTDERSVTVKFGRLPHPQYTVTINGETFGSVAAAALEQGLNIRLA